MLLFPETRGVLTYHLMLFHLACLCWCVDADRSVWCGRKQGGRRHIPAAAGARNNHGGVRGGSADSAGEAGLVERSLWETSERRLSMRTPWSSCY